MLSKLTATFCAWALAPVSMLFVMYIPVSLYQYVNGSDPQFLDIYFLVAAFVVSYTITAIVGLLTHAVLLYCGKDAVSNYTLAGGAAVLLWTALVLWTDGIPQSGFSQFDIAWFLILMAHGLAVSTSFAIVYKKVYGLLTSSRPDMELLT